MVLELSQQQVNLLHEFLAESIEELHDEILHTDTRDVREGLRDQLRELQGIQHQLENLMQRKQPAS
jgi:hypothetical protein